MFDRIHPNDFRRVRAEARTSAESLSRLETEYRVCLPDGVVRTIASLSDAIAGADGKAERMVGVFRDVTEQRLAQEELRELNETLERRVDEALAERKLWADVFESSDALIGAVAPDHRFLALNKAYADEFERIFGVRPKVGDPLPNLLVHMPEDRAAALALWDRALLGEEFTVAEEFGGPDRAQPYYELRFNTLRDREGRIIGTFQFAVDITEPIRDQALLAEAEAARREADALYRAYFENTA